MFFLKGGLVRGFKNQAGTGEAGLGFLQFGNIERCDVEPASLNTGTSRFERGWKNNGIAECERIGSVRLGWIDVHPVVSREKRRIKPGAIGEESVVRESGDGRFEMQTAGHWHADDLVAMRRNNAGQLRDAFGIAASGEANIKFAAETKNVASLDGAGKLDVFEPAKRFECSGDGGGFWAPGFSAERKNNSQFVEHQGGVLDEHGVREIGFGRKRDDARAESAEEILVGVMLCVGFGEIDGLASNETEFALRKCRTDGASNGGKHGERI